MCPLKILPTLFVSLVILPLALSAQPSNNDIKNRIQLHLDSGFFASNTMNASVENDCIDKKLTSKCLIYHNDQWFIFRPKTNSTAYLRIRKQHCRDSRGVQVVVIDGDPCVVSTYKIKSCIGKTALNDFLVVLDSLKADRDYLINIDGFLGDQCLFEISISSTPEGLPVGLPKTYPNSAKSVLKDSVVTIKWNIPQEMRSSSTEFTVYRRGGGLLTPGRVVESKNNARGQADTEYEFMDTLRQEASYMYTIVARVGKSVLVADEVVVKYQKPYYAKLYPPHVKAIDYYAVYKGFVTVHIYTKEGKLITTMKRKSNKGHNMFTLNFKNIATQERRDFKIVVKGKKINETHFFSVKASNTDSILPY